MKKEDYDLEILQQKKRVLFTIEVLFDEGNDVSRWFIANQSWEEVRGFRETVFTHGFFLERAPGRGEVIFPWSLRKILVDIQKKGWHEFAPYEVKKV